MCDHEEILEYGEYICGKCGLVMGQQYISENKSVVSHQKMTEINRFIMCDHEEILEYGEYICG